MNLDTWDELTRSEQERAVGRKLSNGAPLTGDAEHDELDLEARDADGRLVIAENAHARARPTTRRTTAAGSSGRASTTSRTTAPTASPD